MLVNTQVNEFLSPWFLCLEKYAVTKHLLKSKLILIFVEKESV